MKRRVTFAVTSLILLAEGLRGYRPVLSAEDADEAVARSVITRPPLYQ